MAGSECVGVISLIDKGAVGFSEFFYRRPETACEGGKNGFVDEPLLAGVVGMIVDSDEVIEGFDEFGFGLGGVEVGKRRRLPGLLLRLGLLSGAASGRILGDTPGQGVPFFGEQIIGNPELSLFGFLVVDLGRKGF